MAKVLLPISLDRVRTPISTLLRSVAERNPDHHFYSFSNPATEEDERCAESLWKKEHIFNSSYSDAFLKTFDFVHHASATPRNYAASRIAKYRSFGKTTHIFTANCEPYETDPYIKEYKKSVNAADIIVAVSKVVSDKVEEIFGKKAQCIIPNGFDPEFYNIKHIKELNSKVKEPYILWAAQILDRKHPEVYLDLARRFKDIKFLMIGNDPYPDSDFSINIKKEIKEIQNVEYLGIVNRAFLRDLLQDAEMLLFPSSYEGLPLTVVEALGCGCPVIAQPKSSLPEVINHNSTGWMYDVSDLDIWESQISTILNWSSEERLAFAQQARSSVLSKFSWDSIAKDYDQIYSA